jgi:hypothetical protein
MLRDFTTDVTGWFFLAGALMLWGGRVLLPRRVGMFFRSEDFPAIGRRLHLWLWLYRVHLLVARVVMTWLQTAYFDALAAQESGASAARVQLIREQQEAAQRRHLAAAKALATVRKLLTPALSPVQVATRLGGEDPALRRCRGGAAGAVPVSN